MTPRRGYLRPSLFALLALVATRVPACEYGNYPDPDTTEPSIASRAVEVGPALAPAIAPSMTVSIALHAPLPPRA